MDDSSFIIRVNNSFPNKRMKSWHRFNLIAEYNASSNCSVLRLCILVLTPFYSNTFYQLNYEEGILRCKMSSAIIAPCIFFKKSIYLEQQVHVRYLPIDEPFFDEFFLLVLNNCLLLHPKHDVLHLYFQRKTGYFEQ